MPPRIPNDPRKPVSIWKERDSIDGSVVNVLVMILNGPGCSWYKKAGCTMCGYNQGCDDRMITSEDLVTQADLALQRYDNEPYIKIFTSGSFLDHDEIPIPAQEAIFDIISARNSDVRLLIESRPEYINRISLARLKEKVKDIEIAIGLESSSDLIRSENLRKGFTWDDFVKAGQIIKDLDLKLKTYLLLKPPMMGEARSIKDAINSIIEISEFFPTSRISINPMNIQTGTEVEQLFKKGLYRPPWLWSLVETMKEGAKTSKGSVHIMSSPTAGGKRRGAHNCGICDNDVLKAVEDFSLINDPTILKGLHHSCMIQWEEYMINSITYPEGKD